MRDAERAHKIVLDVDMTYSYAQVPEALRPLLERKIAAALAAVREEDARVAEDCDRLTWKEFESKYGAIDKFEVLTGKVIAAAIRQEAP